MKIIHKQIFRAFILIFLITLFSSSLVVHAAPEPPLDQRAHSIQLLNGLEASCKVRDGIPLKDSLDFIILDPNSSRGDTNEAVGHFVDAGDGEMDCKGMSEDFRSMKDGLWGLSSVSTEQLLLEHAGYYRDPNGTGYKTDDVPGSTSKLVNYIKDTKPEFFREADGVRYYVYRNAFTKQCDAQVRTSPDDIRKAQEKQDGHRMITEYDASGKASQVAYYFNSVDGNIIAVGYNMGAKTGGVADCTEIAEKLNKDNAGSNNNGNWFDEYAKLVTEQGADPSAEVNQGGDCALEENKDKPECTGANTGTSCTDVAGLFGWIICEAGDIADNMVEHLEDGLYNLLRVPELAYGSEVYDQWTVFRSLATSLLILVRLIAITAQVFNQNIISAYQIHKITPKILIAAILIFLSYYLLSIAITVMNAAGDGVASLMMGPFDNGMLLTKTKEGDALEYILSGAQAGAKPTDTAAALAGTGVIVGALIAYMASGGVAILILGFMIPLFAAASAFIALVIRKVLILGLIMIAPLAIVAWILPGTEKWFKSWWGMLSKLLIMYPLIIGIISLGRVGAYLISRTGDIENTSDATVAVAALESNARGGLTGGVLLLMTIIAFFAPYFFISSMFKTAGGAFAKISDGLSSKGRGYAKSSSDLAAKAGNKQLAKLAANSGNRQIRRINKKLKDQGFGPLTSDMEQTVKARHQKIWRGVSFTAQGALIPERFGGRGLRAAAVAKNDKLVQEEKQEIETLVDVKLRGLDETQVIEELKKMASGKNQDIAHAALAQMQKRNLNSELGDLFYENEQARKHAISKQRTDDSYNAYIKEKHKDLHESAWTSEGRIDMAIGKDGKTNMQRNLQGMRLSDINNSHGSMLKRLAKASDAGAGNALYDAGADFDRTYLYSDEFGKAIDTIGTSLSTYNAAEDRVKEVVDRPVTRHGPGSRPRGS